MLKVNAVARAQGFPVDRSVRGLLEKSVREDYDSHFAQYARKALQSERGVAIASLYIGGDQAFSLAQTFASALDADLQRQADDKDLVRLLARMQQPDGSWRYGPDRVPLQSSTNTSTALAARVIASWDGLDAGWQPPRTGPGEYDLGLGPLIDALHAPAIAAGLPLRAPAGEARRGYVWHC